LFEAKQFIVALGHILRGSKFKTLKINSGRGFAPDPIG